jgi:phenylalanyl-tRNA synthetase beta chain
MRLSLKWLKELTPYEGTNQDLADRLTMVGLEVEEWIRPFKGLESVVVGHVLSCTPHPEAEKLTLCTVDVGGGEALPIVCGAPNVSPGQHVPVALVGATLPDGSIIKAATIRGRASHGMICSEDELGLSDDHSGIMVLEPSALPGTNLVDALDLDAEVFDVSITPNRADCLSMLGLAREVAAAFGLPLHIPAADVDESGPDCRDTIAIEIPEPELCPLYQARIIRGVRIGPSPVWMRFRLMAMGLRPISNVVDVTNYILMELGQPMHAFDLDLVEGGVIRVARAAEGMKLVTLDHQERTLSGRDLLIWDGRKPVGLAGVMGGANSEIHPGSTNVLLECAVFDPATIRRTARRLGLASEASYRFERGVDQPGSRLAIDRGAALMATLGNGRVDRGISAAEPRPFRPRTITFRPGRARSFLSLPLDDQLCERSLASLGCRVERQEGPAWEVTPPSFRLDLEREVDLVEEVGRLYGLDRIPPQLPRLTRSLQDTGQQDPTFAFHGRIKAWGMGRGLNEAVNYSFVSTRELDLLDEPLENRVLICNPLSEEQNVLRTVLLPGLLQNLRLNQGHGARSLRLFEVAKTFHADPSAETATRERNHLALLLYGRRDPETWPFGDDQVEYQDIKGLVEDLLRFLHVEGCVYSLLGGHPYLSPGVEVRQGERRVGLIGKVRDRQAQEYNARRPVWVAEVDLDLLMELSAGAVTCFQPIPVYPPVRRDITAVAGHELHLEEIMNGIEALRPSILESVQLVDIYQPQGGTERNLTFRLTYRHPKKTLKDKEVDTIHQNLARDLLNRLPVRFN